MDRLLSEKAHQDPIFCFAFFASHDVFSSSVDIINELSNRYERGRNTEGKKMQSRLLAVLMQWIKWRPADFKASVTKKHMEDFLSKVEQANVVRSIKKCMEQEELQPPPLPPAVSCSVQEFAQYASLQVAQQVALVDKMFFDRIKMTELSHQNWMKSAKQDLSPNVLSFVARFNELFYFIVTDVISHDETSARSARFQFWSEVHKHSVSLGNLNAGVCIASALNSVPIRRLIKRDYIAVKQNIKEALENFRKLLSDRNKTGYREVLQKRIDDGEPGIPYLATVLSDLTFIEEGNKNIQPDGLIHFYKFHLIGKQLQMVEDLQKRKYNNIEPDEQLMGVLISCKGLGEEDCDRIADAICAGEDLQPLLARKSKTTDSTPSEAKAEKTEQQGEDAEKNESNERADDGDDNSGVGEEGKRESDMTVMLNELNEQSRKMTEENRMEIWKAWLERLESDGEDFHVALCTSSAFSLTLDNVLLNTLQPDEIPVFQQVFPKFLSSSVNHRALFQLLTTMFPVTSRFSDVRQEVINLCVAQEFNALVEVAAVQSKDAAMSMEEAEQVQERRGKLRILESVDLDMLDKQVEFARQDLTQLLTLPAVCDACNFDLASLESAIETREAQTRERVLTLEEEEELKEDEEEESDDEVMDELNDKLRALEDREKELEEELRAVRAEMMSVIEQIEERQSEGSEKRQTKEAKKSAVSNAIIEEEKNLEKAIANGREALQSYMDKVLGPRMTKLRNRRTRCMQLAAEKAKEYIDLFEIVRMALDDVLGAEDKEAAEATKEEVRLLYHQGLSAYKQVAEVFQSDFPDEAALIEDSIKEIEDMLKA